MTEAVVAAAAPVAERARTLAAVSEEIVVLDYGGQYSQLIARRVRDCGVFSELLPHTTPLEDLAARGRRGRGLGAGDLRDPVSPRGGAHALRTRDPRTLPRRGLWLLADVVAGFDRAGSGASHPRAGGPGERHLRFVGRRRLVGRGTAH